MNQTVTLNGIAGHRPLVFYLLTVIASVVVVGSLTACVPLQQPSLSQPISPPPRVLDSPLMDKRWHVETVTFQEENLPFGAAAPIYVIFTAQGTIHIYSDKDLGDGERCGSVWYAIEYLEEQHFRFGQASSTLEECPEPHGTQFANVEVALRAINEYELNEDALTLRGDEAEMRLVLDNP